MCPQLVDAPTSFRKHYFAQCWFCWQSPAPCLAQTVTRLKNQPPDGILITFQLTDGTVLAQGYGTTDWWKLTPDITGNYVNGTWSQMASLPSGYAPDAFASAVLADGRVVITGGEYNFGNFTLTNLGAIYNPAANTWTNLAPPKNWKYIGDSPSVVLPNGEVRGRQQAHQADAGTRSGDFDLDVASLKRARRTSTQKKVGLCWRTVLSLRQT